MDVYREDKRFCVAGQGIYASFPDTASNRKAVVVLLRSLRRGRDGGHLFTHQELAQIVESANRQAASEHVEQFQACGEDFDAFIRRQRKVDQAVVDAVFDALVQDPLVDIGVVGHRVQEKLGRTDLSEANIRAAMDQISFLRVRKVLKRLLAQGQAGIFYREQALIEDLLRTLDGQGEFKTGLGIAYAQQDRALVDPTSVRKLTQPGVGVEEICGSLKWICWCLALYYWGIPLSRLGVWLGVHKVTIWRWMIGLVNEMYEPITQQIYRRLRPSIVYVDEKWIKIKGHWHYWFVVLDAATEIPVLSYLSPTRSGPVCQRIGIQLRRLKGKIHTVVTDGLASYTHLLPEARHLWCHFHHQQGVTTWLKAHLPDCPHSEWLKKQMKRLLQTKDKRTVRRRLDKLEQKAAEWGISAWVTKTKAALSKLLPAVGSRVLPTTTNAIERFFRQFNRFYKVRRGFHSVASAKDQLALSLIGYLFSKRPSDGLAPIETIWPEAAQTPLYRLLNDPFGILEIQQNVKHFPKMAEIPHTDLLAAG